MKQTRTAARRHSLIGFIMEQLAHARSYNLPDMAQRASRNISDAYVFSAINLTEYNELQTMADEALTLITYQIALAAATLPTPQKGA